jgi:hypothetical protein
MSALDEWHAYMEQPSAEGLAAMLADDGCTIVERIIPLPLRERV